MKSIKGIVFELTTIFFIGFVPSNHLWAQTPGGIATGLQLWLKANAGVTTAGVNVTAWQDQSTAATAVTVNGSPDLTNPGYNYNPYINFTMSNGLGGDFLHIPDLYFQSFFWVAQLQDLTRASTHLATYDAVTLGQPCNGCPIHGGQNGGVVAQYHEFGYGNSTFQTAGMWRKNGTASGIAYNSAHTGNYDIVTALGGSAVVTNVLMGGQNSNPPNFDGRPRDWLGPVGEIIAYTGAITAAEANIIESYLAVKYGITLGGNGSSTVFYTAPNNTTIWAANTGYHNDVAGIGNDMIIEALDQPKSHSINTPADVVIMANNNFLAPLPLTDGQYLLWGHNNGALTYACQNYTHGGPATTLNAIWSRTWRTQKTGTPTGNVIINFDMTAFQGPSGLGSANNTDVRLLVDDNTAFGDASAGEHTYTANAGFSAAGGQLYFTVPYADIQTGAGYFALGFVAPPPTVTITSATTNICAGSTVTLDAGNTGSTFLWSTNEITQTIIVSTAGTYSVSVTNVCGTQTDDIIITSATPPVYVLGNDTTYCSNFNLLLDAANTGATYLWNNATNLQTLNVNAAGNYWVIISNNCGTITDSINIIQSAPPVSQLGNDTIYCGSFSRILDAGTNSSSYLWFDGTTNQTITVNQVGNYWVQLTNNCGTVTDTIHIIQAPVPIVNLGNDTSFCGSFTVNYDVTCLACTYLWSNNSVASQVTVNTPGQTIVLVSNLCGTATDTVSISLESFPYVKLPDDTMPCEPAGYLITAISNIESILWSNGDTTQSITIPTAGTYWVDVSNSCGYDVDTIKITECSGAYIMPNAFSPNGDAINDFLFPIRIGDAMLVQYEIYNRWGQQVFTYADGDINWDGTCNEAACGVGVYTYVLRYKDNITGNIFMLKGNVTLIR